MAQGLVLWGVRTPSLWSCGHATFSAAGLEAEESWTSVRGMAPPLHAHRLDRRHRAGGHGCRARSIRNAACEVATWCSCLSTSVVWANSVGCRCPGYSGHGVHWQHTGLGVQPSSLGLVCAVFSACSAWVNKPSFSESKHLQLVLSRLLQVPFIHKVLMVI